MVQDRRSASDSSRDLVQALASEPPRSEPGRPRAPHGGAPRPVGAWASRLALPALVALALLGLVLALVVYDTTRHRDRERLHAEVQAALIERGHALSDQVRSFEEGLHNTRGLFEASELVTAEEFATYTTQMLARHPAMLSIAWAPRVPRPQREAFETLARAEGRADFHVHAAGDAPAEVPSAADHYPVLFVEPAALHAGVRGQDLVADRVRSRLLSRALATGHPVLSDPLPLSAGGREGAGALLALVVRRTGAEGKEGDPLGLLLLGFQFGDLLAHAAARLSRDPAADLRTTLLDADVDGRVECVDAAEPEPFDDGATLGADHAMHVAGQEWRLGGRPTARFLAARQGTNPLHVALGALVGWEILLGVLLALVVGWHGQAMRRQSALVASVLRNLGEGVVVADRRGRVRLANEAAQQLVGAPLREDGQAEWPRHLPLLLPGGGGPCPGAQLPMTRALAGEAVAEETYQLRAPWASEARDIAVSARPLLDERGGLHGGVIVMRDVTESLRMQHKSLEMQLAGKVQQHLFPAAPPALDGLDLAGRVLPAAETSGDYYDWLPQADGRLLLAIGDVADHGLPSAMMMASTRAYVRSQAHAGRAPDQILEHVNASLVRELPEDRFVTLQLVEVDPRTRRVRFANAGHPSGLLLGPDGEVEARLDPTGPLLGVLDDARYRLEDAPALLPGCILLLLTDGSLECHDAKGRLFGESRLLDVVRAHRLRPAGAIVDAICAAVLDFAGTSAPPDDVTLVVLKG